MKRLATFLLSMSFGFLYAQLPEQDFQDFTFSDIEGNEHHLYEYLDQGKTVVIDVFTTWCPNCTNAIPAVKSLWEARGPQGDDSIVMLYFERDAGTSNEAAYVAQHNIEIPVITEATQQVLDWGITYQPVYIVICPDRTHDRHLGSIGAAAQPIINLIDQCAEETVGIELPEEISIHVFGGRGEVNAVINTNRTAELTLYNLMGSKVTNELIPSGEKRWKQDGLDAGIYILRINDESYKVIVQ